MLYQSTILAGVLAITQVTNALTLPTRQQPAVRVIHQFPNLTVAENIAVRPNGNLIVDILTAAEMYQIDPQNPEKATLVAQFPGSASVLGIAEIEPDVFAVSVGNFSQVPAPPHSIPGTFSLWKVDFRSLVCSENGNVIKKATTTKITAIPEASLANGVTALGGPYVLIADSALGLVWRVNTWTGEYKTIIEDPLLLPEAGNSFVIGINGLHVFKEFLYFSNSLLNGGFIAKIPINLHGPNAGAATGEVEIVAKNGANDDFTLDKNGVIYAASDFTNELQRIDLNGTVTTIAGGPTEKILESDTSVAFGRGKTDKGVLYVTTGGGFAGTIPGTYREGAKVVAVDLKAL